MKLVATVLAGVLFYLSLGGGELWPLAWLAPVPLLVIALRATTRGDRLRAGAGAALAMAIGGANLIVLYLGVLPVIALAPFLALVAVCYGACVLWFAACARRSVPLGVVGFAAGWTALEWLQSLGSPHGTAGSIAYSQGNVPWVAHAAALVGQYGITFLLCLAPAALAAFLADRRRIWGAVTAAGVFAVLAAAWWLDPPTADGAVRVAAITSDRHAAPEARTRDEALAPIAGFEPAITAAAVAGATLVVLPERVTAIRAAWRDELDARWQAIAQRNGVDLVVGLGDFATDPVHNRAVVYRAHGERLAYTKHHLIPGFEPFEPGTTWLAFGDVGVVICKDLDFQDTAQGNRGARVVAAPAWDFSRDGELHRRMAVMRAIEGGFALVRSARNGYASVYDAWGRPIDEARSADQDVVTVLADVPLAARSPPLWSRGFGVLVVVLALGSAAGHIALGRRRRAAA